MFHMQVIKKLKKSFMFSINRQYFIRGTASKSIVYDSNTFEEVIQLMKPAHPYMIKFSTNNKHVIIKSTIGTICIYSMDNFELIKTIRNSKEIKIQEAGFGIAQDSVTIIYIVNLNEEDQIATINFITGEKKILTEFKRSIIRYNHHTPKDNFHLLTLSYVDEVTGFREYKLLKVKELLETNTIELIENPEFFRWEAAYFNSYSKNYVLVSEYDILLVDSEFKTALNKLSITNLYEENEIGYFQHLHISKSGKLLIVTFSQLIIIMESESFKILSVENIPYACFGEFSENEKYLFIGTWEKGYILQNKFRKRIT